MQELHCVTCGRKLPTGMETFGKVGQEKCQLCYLDPLDRLNTVDESDEYTRLFVIETQPDEMSLSVTLLGCSTQLLL